MPGASLFARLGRQALDTLRSGWLRAAVAAPAVLVVVYLLNLLLAFLLHEATPRLVELDGRVIPNPVAALAVPRVALPFLMVWHGVSFDVGFGLPPGEAPFGASFEFSATVTLMLGLAIAGYLLFRAGKWVADGAGGAGWFAGLHGVQVALFYAVLVLVLGFLAGLEIPVSDISGSPGQGPQSVSVNPSLLGAFWMPFLIATLAAGAGALSGRVSPRERPVRLILAGISGGWRAAWLAVALASIGFLIVAALNPDVTRAYLELVPGGGLSRALTVVGTLLFLPNVGTGIAAAAMGGSINIAALGDSCAVISFFQFPHGIAEPTPGASCPLPFALGPAPFQYFLFVLVPLAATIAGGWLAAQRSGASEMEDGAIAGATIALPYALWLWALALVARVGYAAVAGIPFEVRAWIGPGLLSTVLIALVWGVAGGAIGGALGARNASGPGTSPGP